MQEPPNAPQNPAPPGKDDLIVIAGAGGFIAGLAGALLPRPGLHADPRRGQEAAARLVSARARRRDACAWT